jgi:hypothetical protein
VPARVLAVGAGAGALLVGQIAITAVLVQGRPDVGAMTLAVLLPAVLVLCAAPVLEVAPRALSPDEPAPQRTLAPPLAVGSSASASPPPQSARRDIPKDTWTDLLRSAQGTKGVVV